MRKRWNERAKLIGVTIKESSNPKKKLDVFKDGMKVASIGATGFSDYATYLLEDKALAEQKRKMYKARHSEDRKVVGSTGWYADKILWD